MKFRIVPKRDFPKNGFLINGEWVKRGFVVTRGGSNPMPGATWFRTEAEAMKAIAIYEAVNGDAEGFWSLWNRWDVFKATTR
jgi:hypothetical protein